MASRVARLRRRPRPPGLLQVIGLSPKKCLTMHSTRNSNVVMRRRHKKKHDEADALFRTAELNAIRARVSDRGLATASPKPSRTEDRKSLCRKHSVRPNNLAKRANDLIIEDRYTLDEPMAYWPTGLSTRHVTRFILRILAKTVSTQEETISRNTDPAAGNPRSAKIAMAANVEPDFSAGPEEMNADDHHFT